MTNPGWGLRLTALCAAAALLLAVVSGAAGVGGAHRVFAAAALPPLVALVVATCSAHRWLLPFALAALLLFAVAALLTSEVAHAAAASAAFAAVVVAAAQAFHGHAMPRGAVRDYVALTKPRIMSLLLLTGFCGLFVGARGLPNIERSMTAIVGLALACGGASAFNHVLDRDIDRVMGARTRGRPVAAERIGVEAAADFGFALTAASFVLLASAVNLLAALLALAGSAFYVLVYTRLLKRRTVENIVIGGAAGAIPPVVGYAAATGRVSLTAMWLFLIVFLWTPPHFWALAVLLREHYANASVPMLPVVRGVAATTRRIVAYSCLLLGASYAPVALGELGVTYAIASAVIGIPLLWLAVRLALDPARRRAAQLFHYSLLYLALLFVAMAVDVTL